LNRLGSGRVLKGVDDIAPPLKTIERPSMSRSHYRNRNGSGLSRRRVLTVAATVGVGASVAGVAGLSLAGEREDAKDDGQALVISLVDAKKGVFDVFTGGQKLKLEDKKLAAQLLKAAKRG
jgi:hypothetical protein